MQCRCFSTRTALQPHGSPWPASPDRRHRRLAALWPRASDAAGASPARPPVAASPPSSPTTSCAASSCSGNSAPGVASATTARSCPTWQHAPRRRRVSVGRRNRRPAWHSPRRQERHHQHPGSRCRRGRHRQGLRRHARHPSPRAAVHRVARRRRHAPGRFDQRLPARRRARGDWYDEMLLSGDRVVVVGYTYARGGTEVNRFGTRSVGRLRFEDAYHLRSNDYYSSRNYASRLIGNRLIYYTPLDLGWRRRPARYAARQFAAGGPAARRRLQAHRRARTSISAQLREDATRDLDALHSVISCELTAPGWLATRPWCSGRLADLLRVGQCGLSVDLRLARQDEAHAVPASLYRLPFDADRPSAIGARGAPVDQFSFREDARAARQRPGPRRGRRRRDVAARSSAAATSHCCAAARALRRRLARSAGSLYRDLPAPRGDGLGNSTIASSATYPLRHGERGHGTSGGRPTSSRRPCAAARRNELPCRTASTGSRCSAASPVVGGEDAGSRLHRGRAGAGRAAGRRPLHPPAGGGRREPAATPSSTAPIRAAATARRACSACRSPGGRADLSALFRKRRGDAVPAPRPAPVQPGRRARRPARPHHATTAARRPASTGTAMPGRSSCAAASSPCSATSWSRAGWKAAASASSTAPTSRRARPGRSVGGNRQTSVAAAARLPCRLDRACPGSIVR